MRKFDSKIFVLINAKRYFEKFHYSHNIDKILNYVVLYFYSVGEIISVI